MLKSFQFEKDQVCQLVRYEIGWSFEQILDVERLNRPHSPVGVARIRIKQSAGSSQPDSVVLKHKPNGMARDTYSDRRSIALEARLHEALSKAGAPVPEVFWHGAWPHEGAGYMMVMEDVGPIKPDESHERGWTHGQMTAVVKAMAKLHVLGKSLDFSKLRGHAHSDANRSVLEALNSCWIHDLLHFAVDFDATCLSPSDLQTITEVAEAYDNWVRILAPWKTAIHGDVFPGNVALKCRGGDSWDAVLIDLGCCHEGIPQYDMEWLSQRGWNTQVSWYNLQYQHYRALAEHGFCDKADSELWWWGYKVALLQLMLVGHYMLVRLLKRKTPVSRRERTILASSPKPCGPEFVRVCREALHACPFRSGSNASGDFANSG